MSASAPTSSSAALATLAAAPVPPRPRQLLEAMHALAVQTLANPLRLTVVEFERELFKQAERAHSSQRQADLYAEMRQLQESGERFANHFLDALAAALAALKQPAAPLAGDNPRPFQTLTLVEDTDIDRDIVLHEIARREASRAATAVQLLGQRFGVLAAQPAYEVEQLPIGPYALCRVLRESGEQLGLGLDAQLTLYRVFERQVMERYGELVDRINILLAHEGVLPGLVYLPYLARQGSRRATVPAAAPPGPGNRGASRRPLTSWSGQAPSASWSVMAEMAPVAAEGTGSAIPASGGDAPAAAANALHDAGAAPGTVPGMSALHQMLDTARASAARGVAPAGAPAAGEAPDMAAAASQPAAPAHTVPGAAVMDVLGKLQTQVAAPAGGGQRRSIADIHNALLAQMRADHGPQATLSPQDTDTFDLLGMLYSQIQREVRTDAPAADLLVQLQVPVVRAAINDQAFFVRDQHPARELLNAVAESGATWLGDDDTDPALLQKLNQAVEKVVADYQGDEAVFESANQEIQGHFRTAAHKAEVAERRHVEAARGRERLEAAKQLSARTIDRLCEETAPPKFVQALLKQAWTDVLTLTLLRQGEQSEEWQQRQQATRRIAEITCAPAGGDPDPGFSAQLEEALLQVGYHRDEAGAIARRLSTPGGEDDVTSRTELAAKLKARSRLGEQGDKEAPAAPHKAPPPPRSPAEEEHYRQLRTLPFGTWFEFVTNQQGDARRQRLSWYSLITDHALFVNQRGQKVAELSLDALSRLMAQGQARIVTEDKGRLIDRAWQATIRTLRSLAGNSPRPEAP